MTKRAVVLVLSVLLLSYLPILGEDDDRVKPQQEGLEYSLERVEISPDPNTVSYTHLTLPTKRIV